jgi:hypothetical protein
MLENKIEKIDPVDHLENELFCPIKLDLMDHPVVAADGNSYERDAIVEWIKNHGRSPYTNEPLPNKNLVNNNALRKLIVDAKHKFDRYIEHIREQQNNRPQEHNQPLARSNSVLFNMNDFTEKEHKKWFARDVAALIRDLKAYIKNNLAHKKYDRGIEFFFAEKTIEVLCHEGHDSVNLINDLVDKHVPEQIAYYIQFYYMKHSELGYASTCPAYGSQILNDVLEKDLAAIDKKASTGDESLLKETTETVVNFFKK